MTDDGRRRTTTDDGQISNTISSAELTFGSAELKSYERIGMTFYGGVLGSTMKN